MLKCALLFIFTCTIHIAYSNAPDIPKTIFGTVSIQDFTVANTLQQRDAIVLVDACRISFEPNNSGGFSLVRYRYKKMLLLSKNAFDEATITIPLQTSKPYNEQLVQLKAASYYKTQTGIQKFSISDKDKFVRRLNTQILTQIIAIPNVVEGCIIEYAYTTKTDFLLYIPVWHFETNYTTIWSIYEVNAPAFFTYHIFSKGNKPYFKQCKKKENAIYNIRDYTNAVEDKSARIATNNNIQQWIMHNVNAVVYEPYVNNIQDYTNNVELALAKYEFEDTEYTAVADSWETAKATLLEAPLLGGIIQTDDAWVKTISNELVFKTDNILDSITQLYEYIKLNYVCNNEPGIYASKNFRSLYFSKMGSPADLNLFFIVLLKSFGIKVTPVVLRKKAFGKPFKEVPLLHQFNYLICEIQVNNNTYYVDAATTYLAFGELDESCYNYFAFVLGEYPNLITLPNKSTNNINEVYSNFYFDVKENLWRWRTTYAFENTLGYQIKNNIIPLSALLTNSNAIINDSDIIQTQSTSNNVFAQIQGSLNKTYNNYMQVNPVLFNNNIQWHVIDSVRRFPIELPYTVNNSYLIQIHIPDSTTVDHLPSPIDMDIPDIGHCSFMATIVDHNIEIAATFQLKKNNFMPDEAKKLYALIQVWRSIEKQSILFISNKQ